MEYEEIFFSLDYDSVKSCLKVNKAWKEGLSFEPFRKKATILLEASAIPDKANHKGEIPLIMADMNGHTNIVRLLPSKRADPNKVNENGDIPLNWAAGSGFKDVVILLLDNGANPDLTSEAAVASEAK